MAISLPLSYVRSGNVGRASGSLRHAGVGGYGWSAQSYSSGSTFAYFLAFNASGVSPLDDITRYDAFPVPFKLSSKRRNE